MNEKVIEKKLRTAVKASRGMALKFGTAYHTGMPDRVVLMPNGKAYFVELKSTGKKPTILQEKCIKELTDLGFKVCVIDNQKQLNDFLKELQDA